MNKITHKSSHHCHTNGLETLDSSIRYVLAFLFTSILSFSVYLSTLFPEVDWGDSAELSLQAFQLGVTHPPGYPVHTLLGKGFCLIFSEPAFATNILSAVSTSLTVGLMSIIILGFKGGFFAGLIVPLIYAFSPRIWSIAVTTEVYNVNMLILALTLYLFLRWYKRSSTSALIGSAILFGLSLGAYLANLLLLPAFLFLLFRGKDKSFTKILLFVFLVGMVGLLQLSYSYFRSHALPPVGTQYIPISFIDTLRFFTGQQYGTMAGHDFWFYLTRPIKHAVKFGQNFLGLGIIFGFLGFLSQWRIKRDLSLFFLFILVINLGYFTFYRAPDYYTMVTPSYFIFFLWIANGFHFFSPAQVKLRMIMASILILICAGLLIIQLPGKIERANSTPVTDFALSTLREMPENAVVISEWERFTALLYFQKTLNLRQDIILIEHVQKTRYYEHGKIDSYLTYLDSHISSKPFIIDKAGPLLQKRFKVKAIDPNWYQIELPES